MKTLKHAYMYNFVFKCYTVRRETLVVGKFGEFATRLYGKCTLCGGRSIGSNFTLELTCDTSSYKGACKMTTTKLTLCVHRTACMRGMDDEVGRIYLAPLHG